MTAAQFRPPPPPPPKKLTSCHAAILAIMTTWALAGRDCRTVNVIVCHWLCPIVSGKCSVGLKVVGRHRFIENKSTIHPIDAKHVRAKHVRAKHVLYAPNMYHPPCRRKCKRPLDFWTGGR